MEREFVSYEQALALKELGFNEDCFFIKTKDTGELLYNHSDYYDFPEEREAEIPTPLKQQVFRWFRKKYNLHIDIYPFEKFESHESDKVVGYTYFYLIYNPTDCHANKDEERLGHITYEEAENACIDKLIELAKQQDK